MRRRWIGMLILGTAAGFGFLSGMTARADAQEHEHHHGMGIQQAVIKGELVDSLCYVAMAAKGPGHKQCAMDCARAGIPVSILEEGTGKLYTVLPKADKTGLPESVINRMGEKVTLKGDLYESGGNRYVTAESVE